MHFVLHLVNDIFVLFCNLTWLGELFYINLEFICELNWLSELIQVD